MEAGKIIDQQGAVLRPDDSGIAVVERSFREPDRSAPGVSAVFGGVEVDPPERTDVFLPVAGTDQHEMIVSRIDERRPAVIGRRLFRLNPAVGNEFRLHRTPFAVFVGLILKNQSIFCFIILFLIYL